MRAVLDTGVVLSAVLFPGGRLAWLVEAWKDGSIVPLVCRETVEELVRALAYPKFALEPTEIDLLLAEYLPWAEAVTARAVEGLVQCRDPDDQTFLALAIAGGADVVVSGGDLLELAGSPVRVVSPAALADELGRPSG